MPTQNFLFFVSVVDVDAEERVDDSLVKILKLRFGEDFEAELWSWYWSKIKIFKLKFGQDFEADVWLSFWA